MPGFRNSTATSVNIRHSSTIRVISQQKTMALGIAQTSVLAVT
jgi:hypothetical protein